MAEMQGTVYGPFSSDFQEDLLRDICVNDRGVQTGPFGSQLHQRDYVPIGTPIVSVEHLGDNRILHDDVPRVSDSDRDRLKRYELKQGDIVFSRVGSVDRRALVREAEDGWLFSGRCLRVRADADKIDPAFLSYFFGLETFKKYIRAIAVGATMPSLNTRLLSDVSVFYPPLAEQRAIAAVLDSIDGAIERTETVIAANEQVRDSLLHELLTCGVPGWHTEWKEAPGVGTIPADWNVVRLGDVAEIAFSSVDKKTVDGEVPIELCNYTDVFYNRRIRPGMGLMSATASPVECDRWALRKGDVLFTKDSESPDEIGIPAYVTADMPRVLCGYHLGLARPSDELTDGAYLAELLRSPRTARQFARIANGITRFGLTLGATNSLTIPLPPLLEQQTIATLLDSVDDATDRARRERDALQTMKGSVADALLTGRMRVSSRTDKH